MKNHNIWQLGFIFDTKALAKDKNLKQIICNSKTSTAKLAGKYVYFVKFLNFINIIVIQLDTIEFYHSIDGCMIKVHSIHSILEK